MLPSSMVSQEQREFSIVTRRVQKKYARVKKYKLKTKKAFMKRFRVVSSISFAMIAYREEASAIELSSTMP